MPLKHLLVHLDSGARSAIRLDLAITMAKQHGARLTALFAQSETSSSSLVARRASDHLRQAIATAQAEFTEKTAAAGVTGQWWQLEHGEYSHIISETVFCSRYADLVIVGQHDHTAEDSNRVPQELLEEVIQHAGRPVLVVPFAGSYSHVGQRVVIAWNGSREAARAVGDAIPMIQGAKSVQVLALHAHRPSEETGAVPQVDIIDHLACHGIAARIERMTADSIAPMDAVLARAADEAADLLVMGGYGNYGFSLLSRGRNTRHILRQMTLPVLMSH